MTFGEEKKDWKRQERKKQKKERYKSNENLTRKSKSFAVQLGQVLGKKIQEVMFMTFPKKEKKEERCMMKKQIHGQKLAKPVAINFLMKRCRKG
ncbi:uncharacterized protein LOC141884004 isoform X2 [Acropora palmata]|uniref:uncharacterized protein LOC141884004 isoform X2 n=1 Tax=Acropora palmata TaxID=6131 RepID=UPI003DA0ACEC